MNTKFIELGGANRPVRFSYEGLFAYENLTKRSALADFAAFSADSPSISFMVDIAWSGLYAGYRKEGIPIDFEREDIAEWFSDRPAAFNEIMELFAESFPKVEEKKTTPRPAKQKT